MSQYILLKFIFLCPCIFLKVYIFMFKYIFANGLEDHGSISGRVILKTQKMVLDTALLNTQHYKVQFKGKEQQSRERNSALPLTPWCSSY